jgi:hypothetical protein
LQKAKLGDELNLLSAVFTQLGDTLATISVLNPDEEEDEENLE